MFLPQNDVELYDSDTHIIFNLSHLLKAFELDNLGTEEPRYDTDTRLVHPPKVSFPIVLTLSGRVIDVKLVHPLNAYDSSVDTLGGIVIDVKLLQS